MYVSLIVPLAALLIADKISGSNKKRNLFELSGEICRLAGQGFIVIYQGKGKVSLRKCVKVSGRNIKLIGAQDKKLRERVKNSIVSIGDN